MSDIQNDVAICVAAIGGAWPKEARPKTFAELHFTDRWQLDDDTVDDGIAIALFRDAGLQWLLAQHAEDEEMSLVNDGGQNPIAVTAGRANWYRGPTLLSAIDEAIRSLSSKDRP